MIRVFPRKTKWTPTDELAFVGEPPFPAMLPDVPLSTPVYVSVAFSWDIGLAHQIAASWRRYYSDVRVGGPAFGDPGGAFEPGRFLKSGVTITSRGCPRKCPWCFVPEREGAIRELPIVPGWIIQDNNLLACSESHVKQVFAMLRRQRRGAVFSGGLDARLLDHWHADALCDMRVSELWFAADSDRAFKPLGRVAWMLSGHFPRDKMRCYVMIGRNETIGQAQERLEKVYQLGFLPFAQLYQGIERQEYSAEWKAMARKWSRPAAYRTNRKG